MQLPDFQSPRYRRHELPFRRESLFTHTRVAFRLLKIYTTKALDNAEDLYAWNYTTEPVKVDSSFQMKEEGIVFQSLKDNDSPRHYAMPRVIKGKGGWGSKKNVSVVDALYCFEKVSEHKAYFFLFNHSSRLIAAGNR